MPKKSESNVEFQKRTFPARIKAQRAKNEKVLRVARGGLGPVSAAQKKSATKSERALNRVEARLNIKAAPKPKKSKGKRPSKDSAARSAAIQKLLNIGTMIRKAPGVGKRNLKEVARTAQN